MFSQGRSVKRKMKHITRRLILTLGPVLIGFIISKQICQTMIHKEFVIQSADMFNVVEVMIGVWGTLLGFIITAESVLIAFSNGTITNDFKRTGHYKTVIYQYTQTSIKLLLYIIIFVAFMIINIFTMDTMFVFIFCIVMTVVDTLACFGILILMLFMANG